MLDYLAILEVTGADRQNFLRQQFTNDFCSVNEMQLTAWCNPQGRVITNLLLIHTPSSVLLILHKTQLNSVQERLSAYILRSDVFIRALENTSLFGIKLSSGQCSELKLNAQLIGSNKLFYYQKLLLCFVPNSVDRYLILNSGNDALPVVLSNYMDESEWHFADIQNAIPWIDMQYKELFLPQELNLDWLQAMSYQKGCYPGQEVIARVHYRGNLKRRLQLIKSQSKLERGAIVNEQNDKVGTIINAASFALDRFYYGLAIIELSDLNSNLRSANDLIEIIPLPYAQ